MTKISAETVRADFNDPIAVVHYARAAHFLGIWQSERILIERFFPDREAPLLEAGCGAGRVAIGLWEMGYHQLTAFDFAHELVEQAQHLAEQRGASAIQFLHADATDLSRAGLRPALGITTDSAAHPSIVPNQGGSQTRPTPAFAGALFMFNGLMQIPGRQLRRQALKELHRVCAPGARLLFTTHDRNGSPTERALWRLEALRWERREQDERLLEFGDRYFEDETGRTFMHLPDRTEILDDLIATDWLHEFDAMRKEVAAESEAVRNFSDECRFWVARKT